MRAGGTVGSTPEDRTSVIEPITAPTLFCNEAAQARIRSEGAAADNATPRRPAVSEINSRLSDNEVGLQPRNAATAAPSPGGGREGHPITRTQLSRRTSPRGAAAWPPRRPNPRGRLRDASAYASPGLSLPPRSGQVRRRGGPKLAAMREPAPAAPKSDRQPRHLAAPLGRQLQASRKIGAARRARRLRPARPGRELGRATCSEARTAPPLLWPPPRLARPLRHAKCGLGPGRRSQNCPRRTRRSGRRHPRARAAPPRRPLHATGRPSRS